MPTPRIIHFIWAGGEKPFPNDEVLKKWQKKNPDCQIVLWVDKQSTPPEVLEHYKRDLGYKECGKKGTPSIDGIVEKQMGIQDDTPKPIVFADITQAGVATPQVRYEIDRFRRNYGCSSDLLRYNILAKFGGAYFDSDIDPGSSRLADRINFNSNTLFKVTGKTQGRKGVGNDAFICSIASYDNPHMKELAQFAHDNYVNPYDEMMNEVNMYDTTIFVGLGLTARDLHTIGRTGPSCVEEFLKRKQLFDVISSSRTIVPSRDVELDITIYKAHPENQRNWIGVPIKPCRTASVAMLTALNGMLFECNYLKMSRFDVHVKDTILSLRCDFDKELKNFASYRFNKLFQKQYELLSNKYQGATLMKKALEETLKSILSPQEFTRFKKIMNEDIVKECCQNQDTYKLTRFITAKLVEADLAQCIYKDVKSSKFIGQSVMGFALAEAALELNKRFKELGIELCDKEFGEEVQLKDILKILDQLSQSNSKVKPTLAEEKIANILMNQLRKQPTYVDSFTELNQLDQDNKYDCVQTLKAETFPGCFEYFKRVDICTNDINIAKELFRQYELLAGKFGSGEQEGLLKAKHYLQNLIRDADKVNRLYEETLEWWNMQPDKTAPSVKLELECRMHELKAYSCDAKSSFLLTKQATGNGDMHTSQELFVLHLESKEEYKTAMIKRSSANDEHTQKLRF